MDKFIEDFNEFREFLNSKVTAKLVYSLAGDNGVAVLSMIKSKFEELNLNNAF